MNEHGKCNTSSSGKQISLLVSKEHTFQKYGIFSTTSKSSLHTWSMYEIFYYTPCDQV